MDHGNSTTATNNNSNSNPYLQLSPLPANGRGPQGRRPMDKIFDSLNRFGKRFEDATRKAESHAGSIWHHLKTSSSVSDAAMARLAQGTKVLTEGGHDKLFQQSFGIITGEKLLKTFACYLSTATGPVIGTLYISTKRIAFCSDNPIYQILPTGQPQWMYYKVVVPLDQLGAVSPSSDRLNHSAKYINIATRDGHEFWFMGFISYEKALKHLTEALQHSHDSYLSIPDSYLSIPVN